jgi:IS30 family transposase
MDTLNNNTETLKGKHLTYDERMTIQTRLRDGWTAYKIAKELGRAQNTILNEIKRGTATQIIQGKSKEVYFADKGKRVYQNN